MNFKSVAAVFVVLTVVFGASTAALLATSSGSHTVTSTSTTTTTIGAVTVTSTSLSTEFTTVTSALPPGSPAYSVGIAYNAVIGYYLVNGSGFTLYFRTPDIQSNGTSTCSGECVKIWPVFYSSALVLPPGLNATSFGTAARTDGLMQLTYDGWPLYTYSGDSKAGDFFGQGIEGIWFAAGYPAPVAPGHTTSTTTTVSSSTTETSTTSTTTTSTSTATSTTTTTSTTTQTSTTSTTSSSTSTTSTTTTRTTTTTSKSTSNYY